MLYELRPSISSFAGANTFEFLKALANQSGANSGTIEQLADLLERGANEHVMDWKSWLQERYYENMYQSNPLGYALRIAMDFAPD